MELLSEENSAALVELLMEDLPRAVLDMICKNPSITEGTVVGAITKQLPSTIEADVIRERCVSSIRWFLHSGDITTSGNRRYVIVPPYGIHRRVEDRAIIRICGDPRNDSKIRQLAQKLDCEFEQDFVTWYWKREQSLNPNIGLRRRIHCPLANFNSLYDKLTEANIHIVRPDNIARRLPSIHSLIRPTHRGLEKPIPQWGFRHKYDANIRDSDRWIPIDNLSGNSKLVRWQSSMDWRGERDARYFFQSYGSAFLELTKLQAELWMLYFDYQKNNPRNFWIDDQTLWTPGAIPESHQHWLQLISEDWHRQEGLRKYYLLGDMAETAKRLTDTLGLAPNYFHPSR